MQKHGSTLKLMMIRAQYEQVEELEANPEVGSLGDLAVLHDREIGVEVVRPAEGRSTTS